MDHELSAILDELPDKRPRSRLEPYRELIIELRSRKLTFQDIAEVLAEKCGVRVTGSGVHDFLRRRRRQANASLGNSQQTLSAKNCFARTISKLHEGGGVDEETTQAFEFDPNQPLKLKEAVRTGSPGRKK